MTDARSIFDTLRPLSSPTTAAESIALLSDVASMVAAYTIAKELPMIKTASRRKSVATMVIAGVIGFGGVAAAGPNGFDVLDSGTPAPSTTSTTSTTVVPDNEALTTTAADQTDTSTTAAPETTDAPASPSTSTGPTTTVETVGDETMVLVDDPTTAFDETQCADGNHGKTVSSIAQATDGPNKGQTVRDAAHSSCGKQTKDDTDDESDSDEQDETHSDDSNEHDDADDADDADDDDADDESDDKGKSKRPKGNRDTEAATPDAATPAPSNNGNGNGNGKSKNK